MNEAVRTAGRVGLEHGDDGRTEQAYPRIGAHDRPERGDDSGAKKSYFNCQPRKAERYAVMEQAREKVAVGELCRVLDVSESGYYVWRDTKTSVHD